MKRLAGVAVLFTMTAISVAAQTNQNSNNNNNVSKNVLAVQALYNYLISPNNQQAFPTSGVSPVDALFSPLGAQGRIAPLGEGHDLATAKKYFFGVSQALNSPLGYISSVWFRSIADQPPVVAVEVDLTITPTALGKSLGLGLVQVRETGQFTFNKAFQIVSFDLLIPYYDAAMLVQSLDPSSPAFVTGAINSVCQSVQASCTGTSQVYDSLNSCVASLQAIPAGNFNRVSANSVVCRFFHTQFLQIDPTNECPNFAANGGTQCTDTPFVNYFIETF